MAKDLHTWFCVGIICRLETQFIDAHLGEEDFHEADQAAKSKAIVSNDPFDLVKFREVCSVDGLIPEDAIDGEVSSRVRIGCELVEHVCGNSRSVSAKDEAKGFIFFEGVPVTYRAVLSAFMDFADVLPVFFIIKYSVCLI